MRRRRAILALPQVKMVEIKLAQGAKPGKGGVLPKEKITAEIAAIRGIPMGEDCHSPNRFEEFDDAPSLLDFVAAGPQAYGQTYWPKNGRGISGRSQRALS